MRSVRKGKKAAAATTTKVTKERISKKVMAANSVKRNNIAATAADRKEEESSEDEDGGECKMGRADGEKDPEIIGKWYYCWRYKSGKHARTASFALRTAMMTKETKSKADC